MMHLPSLVPDDKVTALGVEMGFAMPEIERFKRMNIQGASATPEGTGRMMHVWDDKTPRGGKICKLKEMFKKIGLTGLAEDFFTEWKEARDQAWNFDVVTLHIFNTTKSQFPVEFR